MEEGKDKSKIGTNRVDLKAKTKAEDTENQRDLLKIEGTKEEVGTGRRSRRRRARGETKLRPLPFRTVNRKALVDSDSENSTDAIENETTEVKEKNMMKCCENKRYVIQVKEIIEVGDSEIQTDVIQVNDSIIQTDAVELKEKDVQTIGARYEYTDDMDSSDPFLNVVLPKLECPVCFEYMVPPIIMCRNGHNICNTCKPGLLHCPTCRADLSDVRNLMAEDLSRSITHPCKFRKSGCTGQFTVEHKTEHEEQCYYAPHKCPFIITNHCKWEGPLPEMKEHFEQQNHLAVHIFEGADNATCSNYIERKYDSWFKSVFVLNKIFFRYSKRIDDLFLMCVMYVGNREEAKKYKFRITLKSADGTGEASICLVCPSYLDFLYNNFPKEKCAVFLDGFVQSCVNADNLVPFRCEYLEHS